MKLYTNICFLILMIEIWGCTNELGPGQGPSNELPIKVSLQCDDQDGDGFGVDCRLGPDCDDTNPDSRRECFQCIFPEEGCPCETGEPPMICLRNLTEAERTQNNCREGMRYCRQGLWSACETSRTFTSGLR